MERNYMGQAKPLLLSALLWLLLGQGPASAQSSDADVATQLRFALHQDSSAGIRAYTRRFYAQVEYTPVWTQAEGGLPVAAAGLALLRRAAEFGLSPAEFHTQSLAAMLDSLSPEAVGGTVSPQLRTRTELALSASLLRFTYQLRRGRLQPGTLTPHGFQPDSAFDAAKWLHEARRSKTQFAQRVLAAQPTSRSYVRLVWAWQRLLLADSLRARRLIWPVAANLERLRWEPYGDSVYITVNIPAYTLQVVRGSRVVRSHRVIVGEAQTATPELYSRIRFFQTSPEWRVPRSIATQEILPRLRRNPGYLAANNFVLYNHRGEVVNPYQVDWKAMTAEKFPYAIRQTACCDNALGNIVFRFPNPHDIYLHDTPTRKLFSSPMRALSHGCIRVQNPLQLGSFLLRRDFGDKPERAQRNVDKMWDSVYGGYPRYFPLRYSMPIYIRYLTCHADATPQLQVLPDVYGRDAQLIEALQSAQSGFHPAATK